MKVINAMGAQQKEIIRKECNNMSKEKNCWNCAYKEGIPGSAHIKCMRIFDDVKPPKAKINQWYCFPLNFDSVWQLEKCKGWAKKRDFKKIREGNALEELFSILGRRILE